MNFIMNNNSASSSAAASAVVNGRVKRKGSLLVDIFILFITDRENVRCGFTTGDKNSALHCFFFVLCYNTTYYHENKGRFS